MKNFNMRLKVFNSESPLFRILNILLLPVMLVASSIALIIYLSAMFLTILVIQFTGILLGIYSGLKWVHSALFSHRPLPMRR
ncbi:hypothetical protein LPW11_08490 [Geomonas sp. RF6]|uniref:hypothetical protein n=1 Tax=Geomonas sp. RF6 TaxID=2897342 RepID=UPI001E2CE0D8|nr:hypothetical protein [Geomonas sp. RF6]UFS72218.1 hypothetical protein LPW11_08490 [Geomonas sp. RF6]